jgi:preprotein translocase subunit YajC
VIAILLAANSSKNTGSGLYTLIMFGALIFVFYFLMIRPQRNRMRQHQQLMSNLEIGDEVETVGGIIGTIRSMSDEEYRLEVSPGTTVRVSRGAVRRKVYQEEEQQEEQETPGSDS